MAKKPFLIAGFVGRSLRFGLEAVLIGLYGDDAYDAMMWFLDNEILLAVALMSQAASWSSHGDGGVGWTNRRLRPPRRQPP